MNPIYLALLLLLVYHVPDSFSFLLTPLISVRVKPHFSSAKSKITEQVEFDTIAREWRFKWSDENEKKSLDSAQQTLAIFQSSLSKIDGVKSVQRVVCGSCKDFKIIISLPVEKFKSWEEKTFYPEAEFIAALKPISGISQFETQTYTISTIL